MAALTVQTIAVTGTVVTYAAATVTVGDTISASQADGRIWFEVKNASGGAVNATLVVPGTTYGQARADVVTSVADGTVARIGPITPDLVDPTTGLATVICATVTSMTVAAVRT